jgi:hypothetical protein
MYSCLNRGISVEALFGVKLVFALSHAAAITKRDGSVSALRDDVIFALALQPSTAGSGSTSSAGPSCLQDRFRHAPRHQPRGTDRPLSNR